MCQERAWIPDEMICLHEEFYPSLILIYHAIMSIILIARRINQAKHYHWLTYWRRWGPFVWTTKRVGFWGVEKATNHCPYLVTTKLGVGLGVVFHVTIDSSAFSIGPVYGNMMRRKRMPCLYLWCRHKCDYTSKQMTAIEKNYTTIVEESTSCDLLDEMLALFTRVSNGVPYRSWFVKEFS